MSVNRVHELVETSLRVHHNKKGWKSPLYATQHANQPLFRCNHASDIQAPCCAAEYEKSTAQRWLLCNTGKDAFYIFGKRYLIQATPINLYECKMSFEKALFNVRCHLKRCSGQYCRTAKNCLLSCRKKICKKCIHDKLIKPLRKWSACAFCCW